VSDICGRQWRFQPSRLPRLILLFFVCLLVGCGRGTAAEQAQATPSAELSAVGSNPVAANESHIAALGVIRPARQMMLSFRADGMIQRVNVLAGSSVHKDDELALFDATELNVALQSAQATVEIRQAELDVLLSNAQSHPSARAIAQAQLHQAQLEVERLQWKVAGTAIRAPFDGVVAEVFLHPGEWAQTGTGVVELIDTGVWLVETKNVSELAIGRVQIGQPATVRVLPFADQPLTGEVLSISPIAIVQQGDTTYTLFIQLAETGPPLLPGMNAEVEIDTSTSHLTH
jgi:RND family efflux transporter MFP subunit